MSNAALAASPDETRAAAEVVERFLVASMVPDPVTAARYIADDLKITFTGGRPYRHPRETAAFNQTKEAIRTADYDRCWTDGCKSSVTDKLIN